MNWGHRYAFFLFLSAVSGACAVFPSGAIAQGGGGRVTSQGPMTDMDRALTLLVSVREVNGTPLQVPAIIHLSKDTGGQNLMAVTEGGSAASFPNIKGGDYIIDVEAAGYKHAQERAFVNGLTTFTVYVYLSVEGSPDTNAKDARPVMSPKLQKEMDRGFEAIRDKKYDEARVHFLLAKKLSPSNPEIEYVLGMLDYFQKNPAGAKEHFAKALELNPNHERTLLSLGQLEIESGEFKEASANLQKAVLNDAKNSQAHLLLAISYLSSEEFSKAREEAKETASIDKKKTAVARLIEAKSYLGEKDLPAAKKAFEEYVRDYPNEKGADEARGILDAIAKQSNSSSTQGRAAEGQEQASVQAPPAIEHPWAPADTDEKTPAVAPDVACSTDDVVSRAQIRSQEALSNFERFGATEQIDHQEIDNYGNPGQVKSHDFNYIILIQRPKQNLYYVDERRDGGEGLYAFPTPLATRGLVSIGVNLFHPIFTEDFKFSCDGLGRWLGRPAWQIRFEQKTGVESRIRFWSYGGKTYAIPLKGRVWISPNTYDILHLETDLRDPVKELQLTKEHLAIDYGPVKFKQDQEELWLPASAEMYFSLLGRRYHHRHTLSDYVLFSVDEKSKIGAPPKPPAESN